MRPLGCLVGPSRNTAVSLRRPLAANRSLSALCLGSPAGGCSAIARDKVRTAPSGFDRPALSTRASRYDRGQTSAALRSRPAAASGADRDPPESKRHSLVEGLLHWPGRESTRRLPNILDRWLRQETTKRLRIDSVSRPVTTFSFENEETILFARAVERGDLVLLLLEERFKVATSDVAFNRALQSIGLSPRESQVLSWVAQGKTNPEIAVRPDPSGSHLSKA